MDSRGFVVLCWILVLPAGAIAQFSGYASSAYGHHDNPLYNFQGAHDQISESYLELNYEKEFESSMLKFDYVSGLMIFNSFADRNYYEHNFTGTYIRRFIKNLPAPPLPERDEEEDSTSNRAGAAGTDEDSTDTYLSVGLKGGARHDKSVYKEFDNFGVDLIGSYRFMLNDNFFVRASNTIGYRDYVYLSELSNTTEALTIVLGRRQGATLEYGVQTGMGLKHFTSSVYDTALFEQRRSFILKNPGKGKGGAALGAPSSKKILTSPGSNSTYQLSLGLFLRTTWSGGTVGVETKYQYNPSSTTRYLAQYVNSSILSEDIYNDHFSYQGPGIRLAYKQNLPIGLASTMVLGCKRKVFSAPAFDLEGNEIATRRRDLQSSLELSVSKNIPLVDDVSLEVSLLSAFLRNQSSDNYNDFSSFSLFVALGISF